MLREVPNPRQVAGEPRRRCFFSHERVDDGESADVRKRSPILLHDGPLFAAGVAAQFLTEVDEVPREIVDFVVARLREHPGYRDDS